MADVSFRGIRGFAVQEPVIFGHIFVMFHQRGGKKMATLRVGHEVEIVSWLGIERRAE